MRRPCDQSVTRPHVVDPARPHRPRITLLTFDYAWSLSPAYDSGCPDSVGRPQTLTSTHSSTAFPADDPGIRQHGLMDQVKHRSPTFSILQNPRLPTRVSPRADLGEEPREAEQPYGALVCLICSTRVEERHGRSLGRSPRGSGHRAREVVAARRCPRAPHCGPGRGGWLLRGFRRRHGGRCLRLGHDLHRRSAGGCHGLGRCAVSAGSRVEEGAPPQDRRPPFPTGAPGCSGAHP